MTKEKLADVFDFYDGWCIKNYLMLPPKVWQKVADMMPRARKHIEDGRIEKAMRWLGFIQGALWASGAFTVDELKEHSRADG